MQPFASNMVATLERAWTDIQHHNPDVPNAVIVVASGTEGKQPKAGHYSRLRWKDVEIVHKGRTSRSRKTAKKKKKAPEPMAEILIGGEGLANGSGDVMDTLLHEAAHAMAAVRGIDECSRQGRYHNTKFRDLATELGLIAEKDGASGFAKTKLPVATLKKYRKTIEAIGKAITKVRTPNAKRGAKAAPSRMRLAECGCKEPRKIRLAEKTFDVDDITCGACKSWFLLVEEG